MSKRFYKVYMEKDDYSPTKLFNLIDSTTELKILNIMIPQMVADSQNRWYGTKYNKELIIRKVKSQKQKCISMFTFNKCLTNMVNKGILIRQSRGQYTFNNQIINYGIEIQSNVIKTNEPELSY